MATNLSGSDIKNLMYRDNTGPYSYPPAQPLDPFPPHLQANNLMTLAHLIKELIDDPQDDKALKAIQELLKTMPQDCIDLKQYLQNQNPRKIYDENSDWNTYPEPGGFTEPVHYTVTSTNGTSTTYYHSGQRKPAIKNPYYGSNSCGEKYAKSGGVCKLESNNQTSVRKGKSGLVGDAE